jgi:hypothetical protein
VQRGQLLARLTWKEPDLDRKRQEAQARVAEGEATLRLREAGLAEAQALVAAGLAPPGAHAKAAAEHDFGRAAVADGHRQLDQVADEARRAREVRSPVDGQVLTLRVHVVHGSEGTAALRLLYRRPSPISDSGVSEGDRTLLQPPGEPGSNRP